MSLTTRSVKGHAKARRRHYRKAQERLARDRRQAQHAAEVLEQALHDLGLPWRFVDCEALELTALSQGMDGFAPKVAPS
jgi:hypothetical protein